MPENRTPVLMEEPGSEHASRESAYCIGTVRRKECDHSYMMNVVVSLGEITYILILKRIEIYLVGILSEVGEILLLSAELKIDFACPIINFGS